MTEKTYRIGEISTLLDLKPYVLRFWETEFSQIAPLRTDKGQRLYTEEHVALLMRIKQLLHEQGMTIDGARRVLVNPAAAELPTVSAVQTSPEDTSAVDKDALLEEVQHELMAIKHILLEHRP